VWHWRDERFIVSYAAFHLPPACTLEEIKNVLWCKIVGINWLINIAWRFYVLYEEIQRRDERFPSLICTSWSSSCLHLIQNQKWLLMQNRRSILKYEHSFDVVQNTFILCMKWYSGALKDLHLSYVPFHLPLSSILCIIKNDFLFKVIGRS